MQRIKHMNWWMAAAGVWVAIAPFMLGYRSIATALWNGLIVGVAVVVLAASALMMNEIAVKTMDRITAVLGLWLVLAPFILSYAMVTAALWSDIIAGVAILVLAVWAERELPRAAEHAS